MATQTNNWLKYFTKLTKNSVKCKICNSICSRQFAPIHLYRLHHIIHQKIILQWNNDNHLIWQHFSKKGLFAAECKFCGRLLMSAYNKKFLDEHLRSLHLQELAAIREEITRNWVSPHFTFDLDNCDTICKYCNCFFKIYDGVDVLRNHLNNSHNIREALGFHGRTGNYNVDATTQQSVTEGNNIATSSQDHNMGINRREIPDQ